MKIAIILGSKSDVPAMKNATIVLKELEIPYLMQVMSAHRAPDVVEDFAKNASKNGFSVLIAGAGAAAALPGVLASHTHLPVIGVPLDATSLLGLDALFAIAQMPGGVPVATTGIGPSGAKNAALLAARMLALNNPHLQEKLISLMQKNREKSLENNVIETYL